MKCFIQNPVLSMDLSFRGIQNQMNDFVLRFMSSKMWKAKNTKDIIIDSDDGDEKEGKRSCMWPDYSRNTTLNSKNR